MKNKNHYYFPLLITIIASVMINLINCQGMPMSPCPKMFQYRFDGTEWFGLVSVRNPDFGQALHLRITLLMRGKPTTNYLGEIELLTRGQFLSEVPILYKVKFPKHHFPPKLLQISANKNIVCFGNVEHSIFMTQIQLEHTRKFAFVPESIKDFGFGTSGSTAAASLPLMNHAFDTKHMPLATFEKKPNRHTPIKDICGTIDERIHFHVLQRSQQHQGQTNPIKSHAELLLSKVEKEITTMATSTDTGDTHNAEEPSLPTFATTNEDGSEDMDIDYYDDDDVVDDDAIVGAFATATSLSAHQLPTITRGSWPWLAAIYVNNLTSLSYQCGGTLISTRIVLSSAHCFQMFRQRYTANEVLVFLGRHNLKNWNEEGSVAAPVDDIYIHPDYDTNLRTYDADIAVIVLKNEVRFNTFIRPACMWSGTSRTEFIEGEHGIVVAWNLGKHFNTTAISSLSSSISSSASSSNKTSPKAHSIFGTKLPNLKTPLTMPRIIDAPIVSNEVCFKSDEKFRSLSSNRTFCAGVVLTSADALIRKLMTGGPCTGDSGAGLMIFKNKRWLLRGIVSATLPAISSGSATSKNGHSTCNVNQFVLYTDVAKFLDWIFAFIL